MVVLTMSILSFVQEPLAVISEERIFYRKYRINVSSVLYR